MMSTRGQAPGSFGEFQASVLFCAACRAPRPVRERLLLVLADGELFDYVCTGCGASLGSRKVTVRPQGLVSGG